MELNQETLKEYVTYNPETGIFIRIKRNSNRSKLGVEPGYISKSLGYRLITIDNIKYGAHVLAYLYVIGTWPEKSIDHKNGLKHDNRWVNLRHCNQSQNSANAALSINNTSGYKGVCWNKEKRKWMARIKVNRKGVFLGYFDDVKEAAKAYNEAALKYFGEFARLNII